MTTEKRVRTLFENLEQIHFDSRDRLSLTLVDTATNRVSISSVVLRLREYLIAQALRENGEKWSVTRRSRRDENEQNDRVLRLEGSVSVAWYDEG